jgi:hypothetical protein
MSWQKGLKRFFIGVALTCLILVLLGSAIFIVPALSDNFINRYHLTQMAGKFGKVPHPDSTRLLSHVRIIGDTGGSQCCLVLFVGDLRQYSGNPQGVADFYRGKGVNLAFLENGNLITPAGYEDMNILPIGYDGSFGGLSGWGVPALEQYKNIYMVYISATGQQTYR